MSHRYLDTSVLYPLFDRNDPDAESAGELFSALATERARPHVTVNVLGEIFTALTRRRGKGAKPLVPHAEARALVLRIQASFEVHDVTAEHWAEALRVKEREAVPGSTTGTSRESWSSTSGRILATAPTRRLYTHFRERPRPERRVRPSSFGWTPGPALRERRAPCTIEMSRSRSRLERCSVSAM